MVAVTADPALVSDLATKMLQRAPEEANQDPALQAIDRGRRRALRLIKDGAQ